MEPSPSIHHPPRLKTEIGVDMPSRANGQGGSNYAEGLGVSDMESEVASPTTDKQGVSGRLIVIVAAIVVMILWLSLFVHSRFVYGPRVREIAAYGRETVAPTVDRLIELDPDGISPAIWKDIVKDTRALLVDVTASNLPNISRVEQLDRWADQLEAIVSQADDDSATEALAAIWIDITRRAGSRINRYLSERRQLKGYNPNDVAHAVDSLVLVHVSQSQADPDAFEEQLTRLRVEVLSLAASERYAIRDLRDLQVRITKIVRDAVNFKYRNDLDRALREVNAELDRFVEETRPVRNLETNENDPE